MERRHTVQKHVYNMIRKESLLQPVCQRKAEEHFLFKKDFTYLFLERGREGERKGQEHQCVLASCTPPTGDLA